MICDADRLKVFPDVIRSVFLNTTVQLCIVHQHWKNSSILAYRNIREKWLIVPVKLGTHLTAIGYKIWRTV